MEDIPLGEHSIFLSVNGVALSNIGVGSAATNTRFSIQVWCEGCGDEDVRRMEEYC